MDVQVGVPVRVHRGRYRGTGTGRWSQNTAAVMTSGSGVTLYSTGCMGMGGRGLGLEVAIGSRLVLAPRPQLTLGSR